MFPADDCTTMPDYVNDITHPNMLEILTTDTATIDPNTYLSGLVSPCKGVKDTPTIISVEEPFDPTNAAKVATVHPTTFVLTVNPTGLAGGDTSTIEDRIFKWQVKYKVHSWTFSFIIPIYVKPVLWVTGCADKKIYPLTYKVSGEEDHTYFSTSFNVDPSHH